MISACSAVLLNRMAFNKNIFDVLRMGVVCHYRVKQAIVKKEDVVAQLKQQYQAALKRADHLEGLLQQQRKQLLNK